MARIDNDFEEYLLNHSTPPSNVLEELTRVTHLTTYNPRMISGAIQGKFLEFICRMYKPARILEIGTFTAYSTICMANGSPSTTIIDTIEANDELEETINTYLQKANISDRVNLHIGDANNIIPTLTHNYDLVYIDGDKREYAEYYQNIFPKVKNGGIILADNVLWGGKVIDNNSNDPHTLSILQFNKMVQDDARVENVLLPLRDGLMFIFKY